MICGNVGDRMIGVLNLIDILPLDDDVKYIERLGGNKIRIHSMKGKIIDESVRNIDNFVEQLNDTNIIIF